MSGQIRFFEKNKIDISEPNISIAASQGDTYTDFVRNRSNLSAWQTTGSVDADNTTFEIDLVDPRSIDSIILIKHNFKSFTLQYWDGASWVDFSTAINPSTNTAETTFHQFTLVTTTKLKLTILGTIIANADKFLYQFIATEQIGQLNGWPIVKPVIGRNRQRSKMISGKESVREQIDATQVKLNVNCWSNSADLSIVEELYDSNDGFLVWLSGGDESQFSSVRQGYRLEDLYLMKCIGEYKPAFYKGLYPSGLVIAIDLTEVVD